MKTRIISLLVIIAVAVLSCQKDEADKPAKLQEVNFGIELVDQLKYDGPWECPNQLNAVKAEITIAGIATPFLVDIFWVEGKLYTQAFMLGTGTYTVTKFVLLDANNTFVMAIPEAGSEYAEYLTIPKPVPFEFTVGAFTKIEIPVEVLCFEPSDYEPFGFFWFHITEIVIREFCFFGDVCANGDPWVPADFEGSPYSVAPYSIAVDMPAIFEIRVFAADGTTPVPAAPAGANVFSSDGDPTKTVCAKFPDLLRTTSEAGFKMELWVMIPPSFDYYHFATFDVVEDAAGNWSILLGGVNALNQFNAVDFAIGSCSPMSTHIFPYPLPIIDGVMDPGEWDGAAVIPVTGGKGNVYVMKIGDFLYVGMDINDNTDARIGQNTVGNDQVGFNINPTDGGSWGFPYDIIFQTGADPNAWGGTSSGQIDGWETQWSINVGGTTTQQATLPVGLESATIYTDNLLPTGKRVTEWKIPLGGVAPLKIGGAIDIGDGSSYVFPIGLNWSDASTFFDL